MGKHCKQTKIRQCRGEKSKQDQVGVKDGESIGILYPISLTMRYLVCDVDGSVGQQVFVFSLSVIVDQRPGRKVLELGARRGYRRGRD